MKEIRNLLDGLPWLVTLLLTIFADFIFGGIYRLVRGDTVGIIIGIIWFVTGGFFGIGWIVDIISVVLWKKIKFFA